MIKQFVLPISEEKRKLKELKYELYTDGSCDNIGTKHGGWAAYIIDPNKDRWLISGSAFDTTSNRMELTAIIEGLEWILSKYDDKIRKHVKIYLHSDSRYGVNLIKEWMKKWTEEGFASRPNHDLLLVLNKWSNVCQLHSNWIPRNSCDSSTLCDKTANERRLELVKRVQSSPTSSVCS